MRRLHSLDLKGGGGGLRDMEVCECLGRGYELEMCRTEVTQLPAGSPSWSYEKCSVAIRSWQQGTENLCELQPESRNDFRPGGR